MNRKIFLIVSILILSTITYAQLEISYSLTLTYDESTLVNDGIILIDGSAPQRLDQPETGFILRILDFNNNELHSFKFNIDLAPLREPPLDIFDEEGNQIRIPENTENIPTETTIVLSIPYFENAKTIEIHDENSVLMLSVDVSEFANVDNEQVSESPEQNSSIVIIVILLAVMGVIGFIISKKLPKKSKTHKHKKRKIKSKK